MLELLSLQPQTFGLDLSDLSLKICQLQKERGFLRLVSFGEFPVKPGVIEQGEVKNEQELVAILKEAVKKVKGKSLRTRYVAVSLPEEKAFLQIIQLPRMKPEEIRKAVTFEAENYIPYSMDTVYVDFQVVEPAHERVDHLDVLIASLPRVTVDSYVSALRKAGLRPKVLEIESFATARALVEGEVAPVPLFIVDVGATRTGLSVYSGYSLQFATSIPFSSAQCTQAIAKTLRVDHLKAEELKKTYGIDSSQEVGRAISAALTPLFAEFVEQVKKYGEYNESHLPHQHGVGKNRKIKKMILCGGGSNMRGLPEFLTKKLKLEVAIGNPWVNILSSESKEIPPLSLSDSLQYTTALGLALRGVQN